MTALLAAVTVLVVLFMFNPGQHGFYPICLFNRITGLLCPGCGALRASHEVLHGEFARAFRMNPLFVLVLPLAAIALVRGLWNRWRKTGAGAPIKPVALWTAIAIVVIFGVLRNVPAVWPGSLGP